MSIHSHNRNNMEICSRCALLRQRLSRYTNLRAILKRTFVAQSHAITSKNQDDVLIWEPVIGLEIHAQINTKSKLFSSARNLFMAPPNSLVSEFDAALPGTLPVLNKSCVEAAVLTSLALQCKINLESFFDRKHYFYADLPQGYQITQYRKPIAVEGCFPIPVAGSDGSTTRWKNIRIEQIQLEQDSGKSLHDEVEKISLIDLNRAGVGLMEIVTAPDFSSAEEAATFVLDLQLTMMQLGTCAGKISEGQLRVDANISLHHPGEPLGVRSEVKNIAGISGLRRAIEYEISRHKEVLGSGQRIVNETRDFDDEKGITIPMRDKEEFQDYRFMPEPNLPPLVLYDDKTMPASFDPKQHINVDEIRRKIPRKMPLDIRKQLVGKWGLTVSESTFVMENEIAEYFIDVMIAAPDLNSAIVFDHVRTLLLAVMYSMKVSASECPVSPQETAHLLLLFENQEINNDIRQQTFNIMVNERRSADEIIDSNGWRMINDVATIEAFCREAIKTKNLEFIFKKYRPGEHKRPKNKKAVASLVTTIIELSNKKAHTKIAQNVAKDMLDKLYFEHTDKNE